VERVIKSYIIKVYKNNSLCKSSITEIKEKNLMQVEDDEKLLGFCFCDKEFFIDNGKEYEGEVIDCSNWVYFGKKLSLDEIRVRYRNNPQSYYAFLMNYMERNNYQYVCLTKEGIKIPMDEGDMIFEEFLVKDKQDDKEVCAKVMFDKLREHIGESVTYTGWFYGTKQTKTEQLYEVKDFSKVLIGLNHIPFVGFGVAISSIVSSEGEVLYINPNIENGYDRKTTKDVLVAKRMVFGDEIVDKEEEKINKAEERFAKSLKLTLSKSKDK
jgi:hypothetical protein